MPPSSRYGQIQYRAAEAVGWAASRSAQGASQWEKTAAFPCKCIFGQKSATWKQMLIINRLSGYSATFVDNQPLTSARVLHRAQLPATFRQRVLQTDHSLQPSAFSLQHFPKPVDATVQRRSISARVRAGRCDYARPLYAVMRIHRARCSRVRLRSQKSISS